MPGAWSMLGVWPRAADVPKPTSRRIVVDGRAYLWKAGTDDYTGILKLSVRLDSGPPERPPPRKRLDGKRVHRRDPVMEPLSSMKTYLDPANIISPSLVRRMILLALADGWNPAERAPSRAFRRRGRFADEPAPAPAIAVAPADHDALLAAIADAPEDDAPRLVYADWLLQRDDELERARGEYIVIACTRARSPELEARMAELRSRHEERWLGPVADVTRGWPRLWSRGVLEACSLERFERGVTAQAIGHPIWRTLRVLEVRGYWLAPEDRVRLVCQPALAKLHGLHASPELLEAMAAHSDAPRVTELAIHERSAGPSDSLFSLISSHPRFAKLRRLHLSRENPDVIPRLVRPGLALVVIGAPSQLPAWLVELEAWRATFDEVRFAASVYPHLARDGIEATLSRGVAGRWSALEIRWTAADDEPRRTGVLEALGGLPYNHLTDVALVGPDTTQFDVAGWIAAVRSRLRSQPEVRIEVRLEV
jgi:uncharacterized protein (TIGR02996 family)